MDKSVHTALGLSLADTNVDSVIYDESTLRIVNSSHQRHLLVAPARALSAECALRLLIHCTMASISQ